MQNARPNNKHNQAQGGLNKLAPTAADASNKAFRNSANPNSEQAATVRAVEGTVNMPELGAKSSPAPLAAPPPEGKNSLSIISIRAFYFTGN